MFYILFTLIALMSSILVCVANDQDDENKEGVFQRLIHNTADAVHMPYKSKQIEEKKIVKKQRINPADKYPDPIFYDAVYPKQKTATTMLWMHNDGSYSENQHIPPVLSPSDIIDDLFELISYNRKTPELLLIIDSIKSNDSINLNKQDKYGNTLLHYAIRYHNRSIFEKLLQTRKVDPNVCNFSYLCPLHLSIYKDDVHEINHLIVYGANLQYSNDRFEMPIITAIKLHHLDSIYAIAKKQHKKSISMNEIDYIVYTAKSEGLEVLAKDLYEFFMLGREFKR